MAVNSKTLRDWLVCCNAEIHVPKFLAGGCNNVEDVRKLTEEEFNKLGVSSSYMVDDDYLFDYEMVCLLHDRTRTGKELRRELLVSILHV